MSALTICMTQIDEYSFRITNNTSQQTYDTLGEDWNTYTNISLKFRKVNDSDNELTLNITTNFHYLFETGGLTINFEDFGVATFNDYAYFPDWMYEAIVTYTYSSIQNTASATTGFHKLISNIVYQKTKQSDWKKELMYDCACTKYNSTLRMWDFFWQMRIAAGLCLINEYLNLLKSLYKLTGTTQEFTT